MNDEKLLLLFGAHVKSLRLKNDVSQEKLALLSELDRTYISGIERGKRNISLLNIIKLSASLNVTPAMLLTFNMEEQNDR
ncbi:MAG: helix-turn-helix domain-containing protein [Shewanella sp.]|uniref:helix-turn-helix domain-containing protein n=1 Tax=Shewanella sp. TaxID=50422 RepID=UPI003F3FEF94